MDARILNLARLLEEQQIEQLRERGTACEANLADCRVDIKEGNKYIKIDVGPSGKYMIDQTGNIYGIKGYGVPNKRRQFGTLDTIHDYYWGYYHATKTDKEK